MSIESWKVFIERNSSWFDFSDDEYDYGDNSVSITSREYGSIGDDEAGQEDIDEANRIAQLIKKKYPKTEYQIDVVDEWVSVNFLPDKTKEQKEEEKLKKAKNKDEKEAAKKISVKLKITEAESLKIIQSASIQYLKEYYEKSLKDNYRNKFYVYYSSGNPSRIDLNNASDVLQYLRTNDFKENIYERANPRVTVKVGFHNWDGLEFEYDTDGRPIKENGETDWSKRGKVLNAYNFYKGNIESKADLIKKVEKIVSDFKVVYEVYVLNKDEPKKISKPKPSDIKAYNEAIDGILDLIEVTDKKNKLYKKYVDALAGLKELRDTFSPETNVKDEKDYFEFYEEQPEEVQNILGSYDFEDDISYDQLTLIKSELNNIGWTMDYGLSGEPSNLRKIDYTDLPKMENDVDNKIEKDYKIIKKAFKVKHPGNIVSFYDKKIRIDGGQVIIVQERLSNGETYNAPRYSTDFIENPKELLNLLREVKGRTYKYTVKLVKVEEEEPEEDDDEIISYEYYLTPSLKDGKLQLADNSKKEREKELSLEKRIELLKKEYETLYISQYPYKAKKYGFKHKSFLGNDSYGELYFHSDFPREFRHAEEYGGLSEAKDNILTEVEEWEFKVDKLFTKYKIPHNSHAG